MVDIFNTVLQMSYDASVVIIAVILIRFLIIKAPKRFSYLLWSGVAFRLFCPISFEAIFSLFSIGKPSAPRLPDIGGDIVIDSTFTDNNSGFFGSEPADVDLLSAEFAEKSQQIDIFNTIIMIIWFIGAFVVLTYAVVSYFKVKKMMANACRYEKNVFMSDRVSSPFALGFIRPKIYIPFGLDDETREQILMHERCHLKRGDHIIKPLAFLILAVHWFNPFCWLAFRLMSLDMEMSCDERVLKLRGDEVMKKNYSKALLSFATNRRFPAPSPIAFSESGGNAKKRIKHALYWKKPKFAVNILCIILCVFVLAACTANAVSENWKKVKTETFGDVPYNFVFVSNGDGTCYIREIRIDKDYTDEIHLIIPESAPNGDKVVCISTNGFAGDKVLNLPYYILEDDMEDIVGRIAQDEDSKQNERDSKIFTAFYRKIEADGIIYFELEPHMNYTERLRLSDILYKYSFLEESCYDVTMNFLDEIPEADKDEMTRDAFKYLYYNADRVTEITFNKNIMRIEGNSFSNCPNLKKVHGLNESCVIVNDEEFGWNSDLLNVIKR